MRHINQITLMNECTRKTFFLADWISGWKWYYAYLFHQTSKFSATSSDVQHFMVVFFSSHYLMNSDDKPTLGNLITSNPHGHVFRLVLNTWKTELHVMFIVQSTKSVMVHFPYVLWYWNSAKVYDYYFNVFYCNDIEYHFHGPEKLVIIHAKTKQ